MRIGVLTSLYPGATRPHEGLFAERRWLGMQARGHAVAVVQPLPAVPALASSAGFGLPRRWRAVAGAPKREERGGIPIARPRYLHLPGRARGNATRFARAGLRSLLAAARPDVVVCDYAWPAAAAAPALAERGIPCVVNGRGSDVLQVAGEAGLADALGRHLRAAGRWCAVSQDLVDAMDRVAGVPGRGVLVPNGVDLERFRPADRARARALLGLAPDGPLVLVVGHLIPRKDPLLALAAFRAALSSEGAVAFLGQGELERELRDAAARDRAETGRERVHLAGEVAPERLAIWYAASDVLLLTSSREGRPNVVLEALASGRPVVATRAGGTGELLAGAPEMMVDSRDPGAVEGIGARLRALLAAPPDPERCRGLVAHLTWEAGLETLERLLTDACREAR